MNVFDYDWTNAEFREWIFGCSQIVRKRLHSELQEQLRLMGVSENLHKTVLNQLTQKTEVCLKNLTTQELKMCMPWYDSDYNRDYRRGEQCSSADTEIHSSYREYYSPHNYHQDNIWETNPSLNSHYSSDYRRDEQYSFADSESYSSYRDDYYRNHNYHQEITREENFFLEKYSGHSIPRSFRDDYRQDKSNKGYSRSATNRENFSYHNRTSSNFNYRDEAENERSYMKRNMKRMYSEEDVKKRQNIVTNKGQYGYCSELFPSRYRSESDSPLSSVSNQMKSYGKMKKDKQTRESAMKKKERTKYVHGNFKRSLVLKSVCDKSETNNDKYEITEENLLAKSKHGNVKEGYEQVGKSKSFMNLGEGREQVDKETCDVDKSLHEKKKYTKNLECEPYENEVSSHVQKNKFNSERIVDDTQPKKNELGAKKSIIVQKDIKNRVRTLSGGCKEFSVEKPQPNESVKSDGNTLNEKSASLVTGHDKTIKEQVEEQQRKKYVTSGVQRSLPVQSSQHKQQQSEPLLPIDHMTPPKIIKGQNDETKSKNCVPSRCRKELNDEQSNVFEETSFSERDKSIFLQTISKEKPEDDQNHLFTKDKYLKLHESSCKVTAEHFYTTVGDFYGKSCAVRDLGETSKSLYKIDDSIDSQVVTRHDHSISVAESVEQDKGTKCMPATYSLIPMETSKNVQLVTSGHPKYPLSKPIKRRSSEPINHNIIPNKNRRYSCEGREVGILSESEDDDSLMKNRLDFSKSLKSGDNLLAKKDVNDNSKISSDNVKKVAGKPIKKSQVAGITPNLKMSERRRERILELFGEDPIEPPRKSFDTRNLLDSPKISSVSPGTKCSLNSNKKLSKFSETRVSQEKSSDARTSLESQETVDTRLSMELQGKSLVIKLFSELNEDLSNTYDTRIFMESEKTSKLYNSGGFPSVPVKSSDTGIFMKSQDVSSKSFPASQEISSDSQEKTTKFYVKKNLQQDKTSLKSTNMKTSSESKKRGEKIVKTSESQDTISQTRTLLESREKKSQETFTKSSATQTSLQWQEKFSQSSDEVTSLKSQHKFLENTWNFKSKFSKSHRKHLKSLEKSEDSREKLSETSRKQEKFSKLQRKSKKFFDERIFMKPQNKISKPSDAKTSLNSPFSGSLSSLELGKEISKTKTSMGSKGKSQIKSPESPDKRNLKPGDEPSESFNIQSSSSQEIPLKSVESKEKTTKPEESASPIMELQKKSSSTSVIVPLNNYHVQTKQMRDNVPNILHQTVNLQIRSGIKEGPLIINMTNMDSLFPSPQDHLTNPSVICSSKDVSQNVNETSASMLDNEYSHQKKKIDDRKNNLLEQEPVNELEDTKRNGIDSVKEKISLDEATNLEMNKSNCQQLVNHSNSFTSLGNEESSNKSDQRQHTDDNCSIKSPHQNDHSFLFTIPVHIGGKNENITVSSICTQNKTAPKTTNHTGAISETVERRSQHTQQSIPISVSNFVSKSMPNVNVASSSFSVTLAGNLNERALFQEPTSKSGSNDKTSKNSVEEIASSGEGNHNSISCVDVELSSHNSIDETIVLGEQEEHINFDNGIGSSSARRTFHQTSELDKNLACQDSVPRQFPKIKVRDPESINQNKNITNKPSSSFEYMEQLVNDLTQHAFTLLKDKARYKERVESLKHLTSLQYKNTEEALALKDLNHSLDAKSEPLVNTFWKAQELWGNKTLIDMLLERLRNMGEVYTANDISVAFHQCQNFIKEKNQKSSSSFGNNSNKVPNQIMPEVPTASNQSISNVNLSSQLRSSTDVHYLPSSTQGSNDKNPVSITPASKQWHTITETAPPNNLSFAESMRTTTSDANNKLSEKEISSQRQESHFQTSFQSQNFSNQFPAHLDTIATVPSISSSSSLQVQQPINRVQNRTVATTSINYHNNNNNSNKSPLHPERYIPPHHYTHPQIQKGSYMPQKTTPQATMIQSNVQQSATFRQINHSNSLSKSNFSNQQLKYMISQLPSHSNHQLIRAVNQVSLQSSPHTNNHKPNQDINCTNSQPHLQSFRQQHTPNVTIPLPFPYPVGHQPVQDLSQVTIPQQTPHSTNHQLSQNMNRIITYPNPYSVNQPMQNVNHNSHPPPYSSNHQYTHGVNRIAHFQLPQNSTSHQAAQGVNQIKVSQLPPLQSVNSVSRQPIQAVNSVLQRQISTREAYSGQYHEQNQTPRQNITSIEQNMNVPTLFNHQYRRSQVALENNIPHLENEIPSHRNTFRQLKSYLQSSLSGPVKSFRSPDATKQLVINATNLNQLNQTNVPTAQHTTSGQLNNALQSSLSGSTESYKSLNATKQLSNNAMCLNQLNQTNVPAKQCTSSSQLNNTRRSSLSDSVEGFRSSNALEQLYNIARSLNQLNQTNVSAEQRTSLGQLNNTRQSSLSDSVESYRSTNSTKQLLNNATNLNQLNQTNVPAEQHTSSGQLNNTLQSPDATKQLLNKVMSSNQFNQTNVPAKEDTVQNHNLRKMLVSSASAGSQGQAQKSSEVEQFISSSPEKSGVSVSSQNDQCNRSRLLDKSSQENSHVVSVSSQNGNRKRLLDMSPQEDTHVVSISRQDDRVCDRNILATETNGNKQNSSVKSAINDVTVSNISHEEQFNRVIPIVTLEDEHTPEELSSTEISVDHDEVELMYEVHPQPRTLSRDSGYTTPTVFIKEDLKENKLSDSQGSTIQCAVCGKTAEVMCSGCHTTCYCSSECQLEDWNSAHHSVCCSTVKE